MTASKTPVALGMHYYPDDLHFRAKDLDLWIPELQAMGMQWLALSAGLSRAIPEYFLSGLTKAGIEPILTLDRDPIRPADEALSDMLRIYHRAGVRFIVPFPAPNRKENWPAEAWDARSPVDSFLAIFIPVAEAILAEGMIPCLPMLDRVGNYWDLAFLEAMLSGMNRSGKGDLVRKLTVVVDASAGNRPLDWGAGGSARWPEAHPYFTPPGSQDHLGFQEPVWIDEVIRRAVGQSLPLIGLHAGATLGDITDPEFAPMDPERHAETNLQAVQVLATGRMAAPLLCTCFSLLAADPGETESAQAWYRPDGTTLPVVELLKKRSAVKSARPSPTVKKHIRHYLLLPQDSFSLSGRTWDQVRGYMLAFQPVCGFSLDEACLAEKVTLLGPTAPTLAAMRLRECGCQVEYLTAETIA